MIVKMDKEIKELSLTASHVGTFYDTWQTLLGKPWVFSHPVFLLDRCWLKLEKIRFDELTMRLPPDKSGEAPELIRYQELLQNGHDHLIAIQECWSEFGIEDFHRAIRHYWSWQDIGNKGWTFSSYLELLYQYKSSFDGVDLLIPLIVLGRKSTSENHLIKWISINNSMVSIQDFSTHKSFE